MRWLAHPLFAPVVALAAVLWGTALVAFLLVGPSLGGWAQSLLAYCFGWDALARAYRLDMVLFAMLQPPLFALVVGFFYADELRAFLSRLGGRVTAGVATLGFATSIVLLLTTGQVVGSPGPRPTPLREGRALPRVALTDHRGRPFELGAAAGRPVALTFVYTDCHASCPVLVATLKATAALVGDAALFVAITLDPDRDTVPALAAYAERWQLDGDWRLLTGSPPALAAARAAFGVRAVRQPDGGIGHDNVVVLLDRAGRVAYTWRALGAAPAELAAALRRLATERGA